MEIRRIKTGTEFVEVEKIMSVAFNGKLNLQETVGRYAEKTVSDLDIAYGAFDDNGKMMASVINNQYQAYFDGTPVLMGGVGGVATLPQYRMSGAIRHIMQKLLSDAYANGEVFSSLFPFSHIFYRKFGYDIVDSMMIYTFPTEDAAAFPFNGNAELLDKDSDVTFLKDVYNEWARGFNTCVMRTEAQMKDRLHPNPFEDNVYLYVLYEDDAPAGYIYFNVSRKKDGESVMDISELVYTSRSSFFSLLSMAGRMRASYKNARVRLPASFVFPSLFAEPYDITVENDECMMARIVNAEKSLSVMKSDEPFTIRVEDPFLPVNTDTYRVADGKVSRTDEVSELTVSIQTFTQLVLGYIGIAEALYKPDTLLTGDTAKFERIFRKKPILISNYF